MANFYFDDTLCEDLAACSECPFHITNEFDGIDDCALAIRMEMFDYMPVIRCEDCKYSEIDDPDFPNQYLCHWHGEAWDDGDHFCSHGVRSDKE